MTTTNFDAEKHLEKGGRPEVINMDEIGYGWAHPGISDVVISAPFPLFTPEAIDEMRGEISNKEVWMDHKFASHLSSCQLRGYAARLAPFTFAAWKHPDTLKKISDIAGVELVTEMDYEIGHINVSRHTKVQSEKARAAHLENEENREKADANTDSERPIVDWHKDSYPYVCVLMMSDCEGMVGGETAIKTHSGEIIKIKAPQKGWAYVLQGRYVEHQALAARGMKERITAVTSFRPKSHLIKDDSVLTTVRMVSDCHELYSQYTAYRLENLQKMVSEEINYLRRGRFLDPGSFCGQISVEGLKQSLENFVAYVQATNKELEPIKDDDFEDSWEYEEEEVWIDAAEDQGHANETPEEGSCEDDAGDEEKAWIDTPSERSNAVETSKKTVETSKRE